MNLRPEPGVSRRSGGGAPGPAANARLDHPMSVNPKKLRLALPLLLLWSASHAGAALPPPLHGPIATLGDRTVEAVDIMSAASALAADPLRLRNPAEWRRSLLDRCVDRELLAAEAVRRGFDRDAAVRARLAEREYAVLLRETVAHVLLPGIEPTPSQLDSLSASGLYRGVDLYYILVPQRFTDEARTMVDRLRAGARFDSTARLWSRHPSGASGGHFGYVLARDLDPRSYTALRTARAGDVLGPYSGPYGHEIYRVGGFQEISRDSLLSLVRDERTRGLMRDYETALLGRYHFGIDSTEAMHLLSTAATEPVDSILATLGPDGTRAGDAGHRAIGVLARADGDSVTFRDLAEVGAARWDAGAHLPLRDVSHVSRRCAAALVPRLVVRDARERDLDRPPDVARELRLLREEIPTRAMVAHETGARPDSAALRAYFASHAARYQRPRAAVARVACFDTLESAVRALRTWNGVGIPDSSLRALGFVAQPRATAVTLLAGHTAEITMLETDGDPLGIAARALDRGQLTPVVRTPEGYAVAEILRREPPRPLSFEEAAPRVAQEFQAEREALWVDRTLAQLRATTRIDVVPSRLAAVRLTGVGTKKGTH